METNVLVGRVSAQSFHHTLQDVLLPETFQIVKLERRECEKVDAIYNATQSNLDFHSRGYDDLFHLKSWEQFNHELCRVHHDASYFLTRTYEKLSVIYLIMRSRVVTLKRKEIVD